MSAMPSAKVLPSASRASVGPTRPLQRIRRKFHCAGHVGRMREFPPAPNRPELPPALADEMLEFYAFIFCQGGFRHLGMTFEQFLLVVATVRPGRLGPAYEGDSFQ